MSEEATATTTTETAAVTSMAAAAASGTATTTETAATAQVETLPPVQAQTFKDLLAEDGNGFKQDWTKALPEHLKPFEAAFAKYPTPFDALAGLGNAQKLIGKKTEIKPPAPDADDAAKAEWRKLVGAPDTPDGYGLGKPENLPEGIEWNDSLAKGAAEIAYKHGLPPAALTELVEFHNKAIADTVTKAQAMQAQESEKVIASLSQEWGQEATTNFQRAARAATALGLDPNNPKYSSDAALVKALVNFDKQTREDGAFIGTATGGTVTYQERADRIRASDDYLGKNGPEKQQAAVMQVKALFEAQRPR